MNITKNKLIYITLALIVFFALFLRTYKLGQFPPSLSWDEVDVGYNAYAIANWGHDEWGKFFPLTFKSFGDDKRPVHVYSTALSVKLLGLSEFSTRFPIAIFGALNVLVIFFLAKKIFKSDWIGLIASIFLAISPYSLQFSRFNHEANTALLPFLLGLLMFLYGIEKKNFWIALSFLGFGISILAYHSSMVVVPIVILTLLIIYAKTLLKMKKILLYGFIILGSVASLFLINRSLLGAARLKQASIPKEIYFSTNLYKITKIEALGKLDLSVQRYLTYFSSEYLFITGDKIARHSIQTVGEFYKIDAVFLIVGILALLWKRKRAFLILLVWALAAPLPGSISGGFTETAHAGRALFTMGSWNLISAYGCFILISILKNKAYKFLIVSIIGVILSVSFKIYLSDYYGIYPKRYAIEWQYGLREVADYIKAHPVYSQINITPERHQPYAFMLFYLKTPLPEFLDTVTYNEAESRSYNLVSSFSHYHFGDWDTVESMPNTGVLYVLTPSEYDGLRHKGKFDIKKLVRYPNDTEAFYIVSAL